MEEISPYIKYNNINKLHNRAQHIAQKINSDDPNLYI